METVYLIRDDVRFHCIRSILFAKGKIFYTLERPWLNNAQNISCIPAGIYSVVFLKRSASGKYRNIYWVQNVSGRIGILEHNGNLVVHTKGCILIGKRRGTLLNQPAVLNSRTALSEFVNLMDEQPFNLHIIGSQYIHKIRGSIC